MDHSHRGKAELIRVLTSREALIDELQADLATLRQQLATAHSADGQPRAVMLLDRSEGARRIAEERSRQIGAEGYTPEHDDEHDSGEIAEAAAAYALRRDDLWPWEWTGVKLAKLPTNEQRIRELEKAGALIAAEIDRIVRVYRKRREAGEGK